MSGDMVKVTLKDPAKVGPRWLKAGVQEVTAEELTALQAEGLVEVEPVATQPEPDPSGTITVTQEQFLEAVAAHAKALADAVTSAAIEEAASEIIQERDQLKGRVAELEEQLTQLQADAAMSNRSPASAGEVVAADSEQTSPPGGAAATATTNTPPSEKAAKTAPKKGAAAATKG